MQKYELKNLLYKCNLKSRALSVILYLLDRANKDFVCFPSIKTISNDLNISVSTTKRALNNLVEIGFIDKITRFLDTTGKQTSNLYVINVEKIKVNVGNDKNNNINNMENLENSDDLEIFETIKQLKNVNEDKNIMSIDNFKNDVCEMEEIKNSDYCDINTKTSSINIDNSINLATLKTVYKTFMCNYKISKYKLLKNMKNLLSMRYLFKNNNLGEYEPHPSSFLPSL